MKSKLRTAPKFSVGKLHGINIVWQGPECHVYKMGKVPAASPLFSQKFSYLIIVRTKRCYKGALPLVGESELSPVKIYSVLH
jgi:hypothetical protein